MPFILNGPGTWSRLSTEAEWTAASKPWPPQAAQSKWPIEVAAELRTALVDAGFMPGMTRLRTWGAEVEGDPAQWMLYAQRTS